MTTPTSVDPDTTDALQRALAAEHAIVWSLQLVTAFVAGPVAQAVDEAATAHRTRRDGIERLLRARGAGPVAAEPAYTTPDPVTDQATAVALLITAESDVAAAWRSVLERTDGSSTRALAVESLTDAAVRATRWRRTAGVTPATVPFPGAP